MKKISCFFLVSLIVIGCESNEDKGMEFQYESLIQDKLECMNMPRPADSYNYPIYPGMEEWAVFTTGQQMVDACQIPTDILKKMSTQAVIQAIWEHPLFFEIFNRYTFQEAFESMFSTNNAYVELTNRTDAGVALYERLLVVNPLTHWESQMLELLISQPVFITQMNDKQKKQIVKTAIAHDDLRQKDAAWADVAGSLRVISWLLVGRTMFAAGYTPLVEAVNGDEHLKAFLENRNYLYMKEEYGDIPQRIINLSEHF